MTTKPVERAVPATLAARLRQRSMATRVIVGICGAPGAGKSTLSALVADEFNAGAPGTAVVVPMDGFHLAASVIAGDERSARRGAPDTFDPDGYAALLRRLRDDVEPVVYAPEYRRDIEDPVAGAIPVPSQCRVVITEGNYLLQPELAWRRARACLDEVWFLEAPSDELRVSRLVERHTHFGKTHEHALAHVFESDERNALLVDSHREGADLILRLDAW